MTDAVGIYFCMEWRWGGWSLFHDHLGACVVPDVTDYTTVPIRWDGFSA
jgi:hypothetical protein